MEVGYTISLHVAVLKEDLPRLDTYWRKEIRNVIRAKLATSPELYGLPLRHTLKGCRKLRVGDYRGIYQIHKKTVHIIIIGHRSEVYKDILKRLG